MHWGVDLGTRSAYAAGLAGDQLVLDRLVLKPKQHSRSDELRLLHEWAQQLRGHHILVEEPPLAGARNVRTFLGLAQSNGVLLAGTGGRAVPVDVWKKGTVGRGGVSKDVVSRWLATAHPSYHRACDGDQNFIDAVCIALYCRFLGVSGASGGDGLG